ncbi:MAG: ABC transporter substrate-binding protein [Spirochaetes bacterium]|nr:ABC transporter substrate-binding protein [Spirochaetota bacterium]
MLMKRPAAALALSFLSLVAFFGCSGRRQAAETAERTTIRVAWWGSEARHERTIRALQLFARGHPAIDIEYEYAAWNDYWTRLTTQAAGNDLPDVMQQDYQYLTEWVGRGLIVPLDGEAAAGVLDLSDAAESSLAGGRVDGKLYGVSLGINSICMMLDADAFRKAGVALPADDWTWADFERISVSLSGRLGIPAVSGNIVHDHVWRSMYLGRGLWAYAQDGRSLGYPAAEDALFAEHLKMARRLIAEGAMIPYSEIVALRSKGVEDDRIVRGKSVITFLWSNQVVAAWTAAGIETRHFELRTLPRIGAKAGSSNYMKPAQFFSVTRDAASPRAAAGLVDYFTNSIDANTLLMAERGVPIASKVREALKPELAAPQQRVFDYLDRIQKDVAPIPPPDPVGNTDLINNVFIPQVVDPVMFGVITPLEGMKILRREASRILGG